jgi:hypothetical protein
MEPFRDFIDSGGRDSVVGIATRCGLEGQGIASQWGCRPDFPQGLPASSTMDRSQTNELTSYLFLVSGSERVRTIAPPQFCACTSMSWGEHFL